jgi:hypothetical protein
LKDHFPVFPFVKPPKQAKKSGRGKKGTAQRSSANPHFGAIPMEEDDDDVHVVSAPSTPNSVQELEPNSHGQLQPVDPTKPIPAAVQLRDSFLARLATLTLPSSPLDELIDRLGGPDVVAEMTGRRARWVRNSSQKLVLEQRDGGSGKGTKIEDVTSDVNIQERNRFMSGQKLIAIISDAASTGISLHADRAVKNQRVRQQTNNE